MSDKSGPAFPRTAFWVHEGNEPDSLASIGMTRRQWLAGLAMHGLVVGYANMTGEEFLAYAHGSRNGQIVKRSYALADAMLAFEESEK